jgi:hypothetical protein
VIVRLRSNGHLRTAGRRGRLIEVRSLRPRQQAIAIDARLIQHHADAELFEICRCEVERFEIEPRTAKRVLHCRFP